MCFVYVWQANVRSCVGMVTGSSLISYKCDLLTLLWVRYGMEEPCWQVLKGQRNIKNTTMDYIHKLSKLASYL